MILGFCFDPKLHLRLKSKLTEKEQSREKKQEQSLEGVNQFPLTSRASCPWELRERVKEDQILLFLLIYTIILRFLMFGFFIF